MLYGDVLKKEQLLTVRDHNKLMRDLHYEEAAYHIREVVPRHFEEGAYQRYHYDRRTRKHEDRKRKKYGHNKPMVFRDQMRPTILATARTTATKSRWRVLARGSAAHRLSAKHREELERVSDTEKRDIGKRISRNYRKAVASGRYQKVQRKRIRKG